jgi:hypothetical protein
MPKAEDHKWEAWCSQHRCHPEDCWYEHNPAHPKPVDYSLEGRIKARKKAEKKRRKKLAKRRRKESAAT